jgi:hypothetical protein
MATPKKEPPAFIPLSTIEGHQLTKNLVTDRYDVHLKGALQISSLMLSDVQYWAKEKGLVFRSQAELDKATAVMAEVASQ